MKVEVTVTNERAKRGQLYYPTSERDMEKYVSADVVVDGEPRVVADTLRALADSIWLPVEYSEATS